MLQQMLGFMPLWAWLCLAGGAVIAMAKLALEQANREVG